MKKTSAKTQPTSASDMGCRKALRGTYYEECQMNCNRSLRKCVETVTIKYCGCSNFSRVESGYIEYQVRKKNCPLLVPYSFRVRLVNPGPF